MKLLALDMDGVINSNKLIRAWCDNEYNNFKKLFPEYSEEQLKAKVKEKYKEYFNHSKELIFSELAARVTEICEKTDCYILWTSTWRLLKEYKNMDDAKEMFNRHNLPGNKLIGYTPSLQSFYSSTLRGDEIRCWLESNIYGKIEKCAVIDDLIYAGFNLPDNAKFFQTNIEYGITKKHVKDICKYLKK